MLAHVQALARARAGARRLARSPSARFAPARLAASAITIIATPLLARALTLDEFGQVAILATAALLVQAVTLGWGELIAVRELVSGEDIGTFLSDISTFLVGAVVVIGAATMTAAVVTGHVLISLLAGAVALSTGVAMTLCGALRARDDARGYNAVYLASLTGRHTIGLVGAALGGGPAAVLAGWAAGCVAAVGGASRRLGVRLSTLTVRRAPGELRRFVLPVLVVPIGLMILQQVDRLVLGAFESTRTVAQYALTYTLCEQSLLVALAVLQSGRFPALIRTFDNEGPVRAASALRDALSTYLILVGALAAGIFVFNEPLLRVFGGEKFVATDAVYAEILVVGIFLFGISQYAAVPLQQSRKSRAWAQNISIAASLNLALNIGLIPLWGARGAALATLASYAVVLALHLRVVGPSTVLVPEHLAVLSVGLAAGAAMTPLALAVPWPAGFAIVVSAVLGGGWAARRLATGRARA